MGRAKVDEDEVDGMSITADEVMISRHCQISRKRVLHGGNGSLQCLTTTLKLVNYVDLWNKVNQMPIQHNQIESLLI